MNDIFYIILIQQLQYEFGLFKKNLNNFIISKFGFVNDVFSTYIVVNFICLKPNEFVCVKFNCRRIASNNFYRARNQRYGKFAFHQFIYYEIPTCKYIMCFEFAFTCVPLYYSIFSVYLQSNYLIAFSSIINLSILAFTSFVGTENELNLSNNFRIIVQLFKITNKACVRTLCGVIPYNIRIWLFSCFFVKQKQSQETPTNYKEFWFFAKKKILLFLVSFD